MIKSQGVSPVAINIERNPSPLKDLLSVFRLWLFFVSNRFDVISVSTPKASLLGVIAARLSGQKNVVYMIRGRAYENLSGVKRKCYELLDGLICSLSRKVHSISFELANEYVESGLCSEEKMVVLGQGSSNGVDLKRFSMSRYSGEDVREIKSIVGLEEGFVFLYSGRLRRDKGVNELVSAFLSLQKKVSSNVYLLLVGEYESFDLLEDETLIAIEECSSIVRLSWSNYVEDYFAIADVFVFPSYREGFGNVAIEASAMNIPVIAYDVVGCRESVKNDVTGILCNPYSVDELHDAMLRLYEDRELRNRLGDSGRERVLESFSSEVVWDNLIEFYTKNSK